MSATIPCGWILGGSATVCFSAVGGGTASAHKSRVRLASVVVFAFLSACTIGPVDREQSSRSALFGPPPPGGPAPDGGGGTPDGGGGTPDGGVGPGDASPPGDAAPPG